MTSNMITLKSNDGVAFVVTETVAKQSETIRFILENPILRVHFQNSIDLPTVTAPILAKVIEYCRKHADAADASSNSNTLASARIPVLELRNWDKQFLDVDQAMLCDLYMAANVLVIKRLQHAFFMKVVDITTESKFEGNWQLSFS